MMSSRATRGICFLALPVTVIRILQVPLLTPNFRFFFCVALIPNFFSAREDFFTTEATENTEKNTEKSTEKNRLVFLNRISQCSSRRAGTLCGEFWLRLCCAVPRCLCGWFWFWLFCSLFPVTCSLIWLRLCRAVPLWQIRLYCRPAARFPSPKSRGWIGCGWPSFAKSCTNFG